MGTRHSNTSILSSVELQINYVTSTISLIKQRDVTSSRLEHGLCVLLLPRFDSLPSPKVQGFGDHQRPGVGIGHVAQNGLGHFPL